MPPEQIAQKMALSDTDFCREISHESGEALGQVLSVNARAAFSLKKRHAKTYVKDRVVLIGDAAHTVHPMAGQGANLGMLDAVTLAETLVSMRRSGQAFWTQSALQAYEKRRLDNYIIQQSMDVFAQSFQPLPKPLSWLRAKMMQATNRFVPLKAQMIRYALGDGRDLPALAKRVNE
jgi:2-octaprenylphenol hydroxylase